MSSAAELKKFCKAAGADIAGIADLALFREDGTTIPADLLRHYTRAVSVAMRLDDDILDAIAALPTRPYADHYRTVNADLDRVTAHIVEWIADRGYRAGAVPASKIEDTEKLLGAVSHKAVARMAGIGWQGKSLLIVSPEHGPRIRLATVLTDMPLLPDKPLEQRCGTCRECTKACPVEAIRNVASKGRYQSREEALVFSRCAERTWENSQLPGIGARICGVCVRACPHGKPKRTDKKR
ncbi:MAG: epoxyqueuosine reductase [Nitrospirae bacterium]|nr:epoxyqueuosine reductase [Nitrospirota bacterium]